MYTCNVTILNWSKRSWWFFCPRELVQNGCGINTHWYWLQQLKSEKGEIAQEAGRKNRDGICHLGFWEMPKKLRRKCAIHDMITCQKGINILKWCKTHLKTKPTLLHNPTYQIMVKNSLTIFGPKRKPSPNWNWSHAWCTRCTTLMRSLHLYENRKAKIGNTLFCFLELNSAQWLWWWKYETMMILLIENIPLSWWLCNCKDAGRASLQSKKRDNNSSESFASGSE